MCSSRKRPKRLLAFSGLCDDETVSYKTGATGTDQWSDRGALAKEWVEVLADAGTVVRTV